MKRTGERGERMKSSREVKREVEREIERKGE